MPEAVIVATARSPIGRANKGSLVDIRPDDLTAQIVTAVLAKVPELDPATVEDLILGCGQPAGESGFNVARVAAILSGLERPRRHRQPLLLVEPADDPHGGPRHQGRRGRRVHRRRCRDGQPLQRRVRRHRPEPRVPAGRVAHPRAGWGWAAVVGSARGLPDMYIAMGQTAENVREFEGVSRAEMDEFAKRSQDLAVANQENGFFADEITPGHVAGRHGGGARTTARVPG